MSGTQMNTAEGIIKVYDHVKNNLEEILPKPTWKLDSSIYSLKISGIIAIVLILIYAIYLFLKSDEINGKEGRKKVTKYSKSGKIISEKISKEPDVKKSFCDKIFKSGNLVEKVCYKKGKDNKRFIAPMTMTVFAIILFITGNLFFIIRDAHFSYKLSRKNSLHDVFIAYVHKLFGVDN